MYPEFKFAPASSVVSCSNVSEAIEEAYKIIVNPIPSIVGELQIKDKNSILFGNQERKITEAGFESYLKVLGIPPVFARKLSADLLLYNIDKLSKEKPGEEITVLERPNGEIASIVKGEYKEIPYVDIISNFADKPVKHLDMSETLLKMVFTFTELKIPDLNDNQDTFYVGEFLTSSLIKAVSLQSNSGLYRTQCSNSFIMPLLGKVKANYMKKPDVMLKRFVDAFECYSKDMVAAVMSGFKERKEKRLKEHQVKAVWEKFSKLLSKSDADELFSFDEDARNALLSNARGYLLEVKQAEKLSRPLPQPIETPYSCYGTANSITTTAHTRTYDAIDQLKSEVLGGQILQWMIFNN